MNEVTDSLGLFIQQVSTYVSAKFQKENCSVLSLSGDPSVGFVFRNTMKWVKFVVDSSLRTTLFFLYGSITPVFYYSKLSNCPLEALSSPLGIPASLEASLRACGSSPFSKPAVVL